MTIVLTCSQPNHLCTCTPLMKLLLLASFCACAMAIASNRGGWTLTAQTPTAVVLWQLTTALASGHGLFYYICLQPVLVITQDLQPALQPSVCTPPLRPHHYLPWSQLIDMEVFLRIPTVLVANEDLPYGACQGPCSC